MIEARTAAARNGRPLWLSTIAVGIRSLLAHLTFMVGMRVGAGKARVKVIHEIEKFKSNENLNRKQ